MPYRTNQELPDAVKGSLPEHAQTIFRNVFNSTAKAGASEESSMKQAWGAVKNAGYEKDEKSNRWRRVRKSIDAALELVVTGYDPETLDRYLMSDEGHQTILDLIGQTPMEKTRSFEGVRMDKDAVRVAKVDEERRLVFGFFSINKVGGDLVTDLQGDMMETDTLESAAYDFVLNARVGGEVHVRKNVARLVESVVFSYEKQQAIQKCLEVQGIQGKIDLGCEGWFGGFYVDDDDVWAAVKKGEYPAFSIGGSGKRTPISD